jgi:probable rRNA maturation factor
MRSKVVSRQSSVVSVTNKNRSYKLNELLIEKLAVKTLKLIKKESNIEVEIIFLDDKSIKALNKRYKGEDAPTDVLSFKIDRKEFGEKRFLGEIFVSIDTARRNAGSFGTDIAEEAVLYIIHGILHLFGYDDLRAKNRLRMSRKQEEILCQLHKCQNLSKVLTPR